MKSPTATVSEIIMMVSLGAGLAIKDSNGKTPSIFVPEHYGLAVSNVTG
jgi:hypothetical protein